MQINIKQINMEMDMSSSISIIPEDVYKKNFSDCELQNSECVLQDLWGQKTKVKGMLKVKVRY